MIIGAAGRVDLILDMLGEPGSTTAVSDSFYRDSFDLIKLVFEYKPLRRAALDSPVELPRPSIPDPDPSVTDALLITIAGVEGHVPASDIRRLPYEKPTDIRGLTAPGIQLM